MPEIYSPSDDSFFMVEVLGEKIPEMLKKNENINFLEIGSGSGINLQTAFKLGIKKENIFSSDINPEAVRHCKKLGFNCVDSNLFQKIEGTYDLIIFNPPYLPKDDREPLSSRIATTGGKKGNEIINKFLKNARNFLKDNGKIFLLVSDLSGKINFDKYKKKILKKKKLFFEELTIFELRREI